MQNHFAVFLCFLKETLDCIHRQTARFSWQLRRHGSVCVQETFFTEYTSLHAQTCLSIIVHFCDNVRTTCRVLLNRAGLKGDLEVSSSVGRHKKPNSKLLCFMHVQDLGLSAIAGNASDFHRASSTCRAAAPSLLRRSARQCSLPVCRYCKKAALLAE